MPALASQPVRVLISGLGPVTCLGFGMDDLVEGMADVTVMQDTELKAARLRSMFGIIRDFDLSQFTDTRRPYLDPQSRCALAGTALALESAGVEADEVDPWRCGLSFATVLGNLETQMIFQRQVDEKGMRLGSPVLFSHAYANSTNSVLSIEFSLRGYNQNFCGDLLCGAQALEVAMLAIRSGKADLMVAGGADVTGPELLQRLRLGTLPDAPLSLSWSPRTLWNGAKDMPFVSWARSSAGGYVGRAP
jgi:3-oxoacyl-[acyl-carrier-protein] synthase II